MRHVDAVTERILPVGGARLFVREIGQGTPVVVLHGGPSLDLGYLLPELDDLADTFRLISYDQRGRGRSRHGVRPEDVTVASEIEDLEHVRATLGLESMALAGHSWGGLLAMEYATTHPDRLSHLVLLNTAPASHAGFSLFGDHLARIRAAGEAELMQEIESTDEYLRGDVEAAAAYDRIHFAPAFAAPALVEELVSRLGARTDERGIVESRAISDRLFDETWRNVGYDLTPRLRTLTVATLLVHGDHDFIPIEVVEHIADAIPGAVLHVLAGCGHFPLLEAPSRLHALLTEFVQPSD